MTNKSSKMKFGVKMGKVSGDGGKGSVLMTIGNDELNGDDAEGMFVGAQVKWKFKVNPSKNDDAKGQQTMDDGALSASGIAEINSFHTYPDRYTATLSFKRESCDFTRAANDPMQMSYATGRFECERIGNATEAEPEAAGE